MFAMLLTGCGGGNQGSAEGSQAAAIGQGVAEAESCIKIGVSGTPDLDPAIVNTGSSLIAAINTTLKTRLFFIWSSFTAETFRFIPPKRRTSHGIFFFFVFIFRFAH